MLEDDFKKKKVAAYFRLSREETNEIEDNKLSDKLNQNLKRYAQRDFENLDRKKRVKYRLPLKNIKLVTYQTSADGDREYLDKCMKFYKKNRLKAFGVFSKEEDLAQSTEEYLKKYNPDILVITGHDAYYRKKRNDANYKNTDKFIDAIKVARKYENSHEKLAIVAGACQSNYEELIKAGANFASSPKRINIHALDPAIVAASLAFSDKNNNIDLIKILDKTKYGSDGIGGIITKGTMYIGYPR